MSNHMPVEEIGRLAATRQVGAIVLAEHIVDTHVAGFATADEQALALDALLRDLARLRRRAPELDDFIADVEVYIDGLHRGLIRLAA